MIRGAFRVALPGHDFEMFIPNTIMDEGDQAFLKMLLRGDDSIVGAGDDFYVGLCGNISDPGTVLATLTGEPTVTHGYARQALSRDGTGWPTLDKPNGLNRMQSKQVTFTATGGDFSSSVRRLFLCSVSAGTAGTLFAISGPLSGDFLITSGMSIPVKYELYLR